MKRILRILEDKGVVKISWDYQRVFEEGFDSQDMSDMQSESSDASNNCASRNKNLFVTINNEFQQNFRENLSKLDDYIEI